MHFSTTGILAVLTLAVLTLRARAWTVDLFEGTGCNVNGVGKLGTDTACIAQGGGSWGIASNDEGCWFQSYSGNDCRGSNTDETQAMGCQQFLFGSISVQCEEE